MTGSPHRRIARSILGVAEAVVAMVVVAMVLGAPVAAGSGLAPEREAQLLRWHPRFDERCLLPGADRTASRWTRELASLTVFLDRDEVVAGPLLDAARRSGVLLCLDDRYDGTYGYYDYALNVIVLSDRLSAGERAVILVHELRHVDLVRRGYCPSLTYDMDAAAHVTCAAEADVQALATLFAWRMRERGEPGPWRAVERFERYEDIAPAFAATVKSGGRLLDATRAAFEQWFASRWRTATYRRSACMGYLDRCDAAKAVPSYADLPKDWFKGMCVLPDGRDYGCRPTAKP